MSENTPILFPLITDAQCCCFEGNRRRRYIMQDGSMYLVSALPINEGALAPVDHYNVRWQGVNSADWRFIDESPTFETLSDFLQGLARQHRVKKVEETEPVQLLPNQQLMIDSLQEMLLCAQAGNLKGIQMLTFVEKNGSITKASFLEIGDINPDTFLGAITTVQHQLSKTLSTEWFDPLNKKSD